MQGPAYHLDHQFIGYSHLQSPESGRLVLIEFRDKFDPLTVLPGHCQFYERVVYPHADRSRSLRHAADLFFPNQWVCGIPR